MTTYFDADAGSDLSEEYLREAEPDVQRAAMEDWFRARFEDPAERTPYESAEGGYIWIWGGPYNAREELESEFGSIVPEEVIQGLVKDLEYDCHEWAPTPSASDYDDFLLDDIAGITSYYNSFSGAVLDIEALLRTMVPDPVAGCFYRLLFVNVITALETYLSDAFIITVINQPELMRKFVETTPEFRAEKISLADAYKATELAERRARTYLADVVWHHLERVKSMYRETLDLEFPENIGPIFRAILTRHDIVHRNGKSKDGEEILITEESVRQLIADVEALVIHIDECLTSRADSQASDNTEGEESAF
jgi:hypothetical protein